MKVISHRGNLTGRIPSRENEPEYIDEAIRQGYEVEIDLRVIHNGDLYLGHDDPQYLVTREWLEERIEKLWIHAKNLAAADFLSRTFLHWFFHQDDVMTITSRGIPWLSPKNYLEEGITVEFDYLHIPRKIMGVCTDDPISYTEKKNY